MEIYHQTTIKVLPQAVKTGLCALHKKCEYALVSRALWQRATELHTLQSPQISETRLEKCRDGN